MAKYTLPEKLAQIKGEHLMKDAEANGHKEWLKAKAAEVREEEDNNMKAFAKLRKAYLAEFHPQLLEKKKKTVKSKSIFDKIAEF